MSYFWDRICSPHKIIAALFLRIAIMITILLKCIIYKDCEYYRSPHKNIMFLSFYRIVTMITVFFIRTAIMITVFTKMFYIWVSVRTVTMIAVLLQPQEMPYFWIFMRTTNMIAILTKCPISESVLIDCDHKSQSSYQYRHHHQTPVHWHQTIPNAFQI